ncbi:MAG TPA: glycerophosphodiester phosphodiesterase family protein [Candidatus Saccharimonadales bacterium]|nr:glycerophosphodiester phosphodiesterase family protein [Candidatus Saccharimonadales bacterium]
MISETLVVYHRCGGKTLGYPPNTLLTAQWAKNHGAKAIEYDVAIAKDGNDFKVFVIEPKLLNDAGLDINDLNWEDVLKIDTGNDKFGRQPVTTLEEMLKTIDSGHVAHQIQIKGQHPATVEEVLKRTEKAKDYIITAFDRNVIKEIKNLNNSVRVGWLVKPAQEAGDEAGVDLTAKLVAESGALKPYSDMEIDEILKTASEDQVDIVLLCGPRIKEKSLIDRVKKSGFQIGAWGVATNIDLAIRLIDLGLDRFTLDNPEQLN